MKEDAIENKAYAHYGFDICFNIVAIEQDEEAVADELGETFGECNKRMERTN